MLLSSTTNMSKNQETSSSYQGIDTNINAELKQDYA